MSDAIPDEVAHWNWEAGFWDDYIADAPDEDVHWLIAEAQASGSPVLEIGCGTGRSLIPIAQSGISIVGLDLSPSMLAKARAKIAELDVETQQRIELVEGDLRSFSLGRRFPLVTITYAFFFLTTPQDQRQALRCIHLHLLEGGHLILINDDPKLEVIAARLGPLGTSLQKSAEFIRQATGHRVVVWRAREVDLERQLAKTLEILEEVDPDGRVIERRYNTLTSRFTYRYEMHYLLELCGYRIEALYGDFHRGPFQPGGRQIWVARKE
jgi:ubiquinone/menaquinone biosynthesis C-methylase UbiE